MEAPMPIRIFDASREELFNSLEDTETLLLNEGQKAVIVSRLANATRGKIRAGETRTTRKQIADRLGVSLISAHWATKFIQKTELVEYAELRLKVEDGSITLTEACKIIGLRSGLSSRTTKLISGTRIEQLQVEQPVEEPEALVPEEQNIEAECLPPQYISREFLERKAYTINLTAFPAEVLLGSMQDGIIDCIITDPPYNAGISSWDVGFEPEQYIRQFLRVLKPGGSALIFCHSVLLPLYISNPLVGYPPSEDEIKSVKKELKKAIKLNNGDKIEKFTSLLDKILNKKREELGKPFLLQQILHWQKTNNPNKQKCKEKRNEYQPTVEYIVWLVRNTPGSQKVPKHTYNLPRSFEDFISNRMTDVFTTPIVSGYQKYEANRHSVQESPKPFRLIEMLVKTHSNPDDVILDPFHGKGITALVCWLCERRFIGSEIDNRKVVVQMLRFASLRKYVFANQCLRQHLTIRHILSALKKTDSVRDYFFTWTNGQTVPVDSRHTKIDTVNAWDFWEYVVYTKHIEEVIRNMSSLVRLLSYGADKDQLTEAIKKAWEKGSMYFEADDDNQKLTLLNELAHEVLGSVYANQDIADSQFEYPEENPIRRIKDDLNDADAENGFVNIYHYWACPPFFSDDVNTPEPVELLSLKTRRRRTA
jgi:DNA modification methylase